MKRVKIAELKNHLSAHLRAVERGAEIEVTDRDRPIARIVPVLDSATQLRIIPPKRLFSALREKRYPPTRWPVDLVELLIEDRTKR